VHGYECLRVASVIAKAKSWKWNRFYSWSSKLIFSSLILGYLGSMESWNHEKQCMRGRMETICAWHCDCVQGSVKGRRCSGWMAVFQVVSCEGAVSISSLELTAQGTRLPGQSG
jgi:hypothetical protein